MDGRGKQALLTWLSLLRTSNRIKKDIDGRLKASFGQSISRFDALSALQRAGAEGIRAGQLSRQMVVSEGNITQLMGKLLRDQLVTKSADALDARVVIYRLSEAGETLFDAMAMEHRQWIENIFDELSDADTAHLQSLMGQLSAAFTMKETA
ncbi:MAG: MarR family winged helix-turn-helix transcriptional regulator [Pseudomonadota bacterium]